MICVGALVFSIKGSYTWGLFYGPVIFFVVLLLVGTYVYFGEIDKIWSLRSLNQLRRTFPDSDCPPPGGPFMQLTSDKPTPFPEKYDFLRSLPRPRKVRKVASRVLWRPKKRLLTEGEITFGWVIAQKNGFEVGLYGSSISYSQITYEFLDFSGFVTKGKAIDETESFFEEMVIPVFYDPQNPRQNTALTNLEEIVKPGDE